MYNLTIEYIKFRQMSQEETAGAAEAKAMNREPEVIEVTADAQVTDLVAKAKTILEQEGARVKILAANEAATDNAKKLAEELQAAVTDLAD